MKPVIRSLIAAVAAFVAFYYVYWFRFDMILENSYGPPWRWMWFRILGSLVCAAVAAQYTWRHKSLAPQRPVSSMILALSPLRAVGFYAGFYGPIIFQPRAPQGPLFGIFISGPLSFLFGAVAGPVCWGFWTEKKQKISNSTSKD